jgi:small-conductance mechanosensitive channel
MGIKTHIIVESTSYSVTVLQCVYNRCSKWLLLAWVHNLAHFKMGGETVRITLRLLMCFAASSMHSYNASLILTLTLYTMFFCITTCRNL